MFDIGMTELMVIAVVAIIVVGPKDLPGMLRNAAKYVGQMRSMARDFQNQMDAALKEADLADVHDTIKGVGDLNPVNKIKSEVSDYMQSARAFDEPDEDYVAAGDELAKTEAIDSGVPADTSPTPGLDAARESAVAAQKTAAPDNSKSTKPLPKKPPAKKPPAKRATAKKVATNKTVAAKTTAAKKASTKRAAGKTSS